MNKLLIALVLCFAIATAVPLKNQKVMKDTVMLYSVPSFFPTSVAVPESYIIVSVTEAQACGTIPVEAPVEPNFVTPINTVTPWESFAPVAEYAPVTVYFSTVGTPVWWSPSTIETTVVLTFVPETLVQPSPATVLPPSIPTNEVTVIIHETTDYIISRNDVISTFITIVIPATVIESYVPNSIIVP